MTVKIDGTNTVANPAFTGADTDTGLQCGTNELKLVTGGTARATVDSNGNVGIGNSSPTNSAGYNTLTIGNGTSTGGQIHLETSSGNNFYLWHDSNGANIYNQSATSQIFYTNATERLRITSDGTIRLASGCPGIDFSQIQTNASGMSSETLDSYEEGTWTPTLSAGGTITTLSNASYTKIGRRVSVQFYYTAATLGTGTAEFQVGGLPFTVRQGYGFGNIAYAAATDVDVWRPLFALNNSHIYFHRVDGSGATLKNSGASTVLLGGGEYFTDS